MPNAKAPPVLLDSLQRQVELLLVCSKCSMREDEITYRPLPVEHKCMYEILLARCRSRHGVAWRKVFRRPGFPNPARYAVCRYYRLGLGCSKHGNQCTFAWSPEEALVWNFEREHRLERRWLKAAVLLAQLGGSSSAEPLSACSEILSEFGGQFQETAGFASSDALSASRWAATGSCVSRTASGTRCWCTWWLTAAARSSTRPSGPAPSS